MSKKSKTPASRLFEKELLTDEDLMVIFGVSKSTLKRWRDKGILGFSKFGNINFYPSKLLKKIIKDHTHPYYRKKNNYSALDDENEKTNDKA
jgi:hypothetical protein